MDDTLMDGGVLSCDDLARAEATSGCQLPPDDPSLEPVSAIARLLVYEAFRR